MTLFALAVLAASAVAAPQAANAPLMLQAPTSPASIASVAAGISLNLANYYTPNSWGAILMVVSDGTDSRQWYESGVMWGALMEYIDISGNGTLAPVVTASLSNASYAPTNVGSFLGPDRSAAATLLGRWNDDIGWYGLASATSAAIYGNQATLPGSSLTYLQVAAQTFSEIWEEWDTSCGGGIFWSRDRVNPKTKNYKSTISNAQAMILAARLAILTGNSSYSEKASAIYGWLKTSGLINQQKYFVYDGLDVTNCSINGAQFSYNPGFILGGLGWLYNATNNIAYIQEATPILAATLSTNTVNNVIIDICEGMTGVCTTNSGAASIAPAINVAQYKGAMIRGLMYLYLNTPDANQKEAIKTAITASYQGMIPTCNTKYDCNQIWTPNAPFAPATYQAELVAIELANAAIAIYGGNMPTSFTQTGVKLTNPSNLDAGVPGQMASRKSSAAMRPEYQTSLIISFIASLAASFILG